MLDAGAESDSSEMTDLDALEEAWHLTPASSPPQLAFQAPGDNDPPSSSDACTRRSSAATTSHDAPAPRSTPLKHCSTAQPALAPSSPPDLSRLQPTPATRRRSLASASAAANSSTSKRRRSEECDPGEGGGTDRKHPRVTGRADEQARAARARKRASRGRADGKGDPSEAVEPSPAPLGPLQGRSKGKGVLPRSEQVPRPSQKKSSCEGDPAASTVPANQAAAEAPRRSSAKTALVAPAGAPAPPTPSPPQPRAREATSTVDESERSSDASVAAARPMKRARKPTKRYVDEIDEQQLLKQRPSQPEPRSAPPPPPPPPPSPPSQQKVQLPGLKETGLDVFAKDPVEGFLTRAPLGNTGSPARAMVGPSPTPVLVQPQDPDLGRPQVTLPAILPALPPPASVGVSAPVAGPSRAPLPPPPPSLKQVAPPKSAPPRKSAKRTPADPTSKPPKPPKPLKTTKPRARHAALDSRASWVPVERDLRITAAGKPPIWCIGRQELCESLEYFRSYQGGHYDSQERCLGYLLDGFPSPSDACSARGKVIISHGGGCSEVLAVGGARLRANQTRDGTRVRALTNCMRTRTPVVLLAGAMYEHFPKLKDMGEGGVRYAVLGHYIVTDIWAEGEPVEGDKDNKHFVRFKVRFEWLASQGEPWFTDVIGKDPSTPNLEATGSASTPSTAPPLDCASAAPATVSDKPLNVDLPPAPIVVPPSPAPVASIAASVLANLHFKRLAPTPSIASVAARIAADGAGSDMDISSDSEASPAPPHSPWSDHTADSGFVDVTSPPGEKREHESVTCGTCAASYKRVYCEEVECHNEVCDKFFKVDGRMPVPGSLTYRPSLLTLTPSPPSSDVVPQPLAPRTLQSLNGASQISDYTFLAWRGFGCSACGRLSSRGEWSRLVCAGCGAETDATARIFRAVELEGKSKGHAPELGPSFLLAPYGATRLGDARGYEGYTVDLSPADGSGGTAKVHHFWPITASAIKEGDRLFEEYQGLEAGRLFRRNKLARHAATGALLCQQFTFNAGERYSHAVSMATYPFPPLPTASSATHTDKASEACAPECARDARDYLETVVRSVVGEHPETNFNEILSVAYMTGGKMNYHDDGERGLGQFVASVSLGSDAIMSFRSKAAKKPRRAAAKAGDEVDTDADADDEGDDGASGKKGKGNKSRVVLKARLKHGHVLIMEGTGMQKLYEHKVEPEGLRFAATARWIGPDHLAPRPKSSASVQPVASSAPSASRLAYQNSAPTSAPPPAAHVPCLVRTGAQLPPRPALLSAASLPRPPPIRPPNPIPASPTFPTSLPPSSVAVVIAAQLGVPPHDKHVRDTPRAHPRGAALPAAQLLHEPRPPPTRGVPIGPPAAPPDAT